MTDLLLLLDTYPDLSPDERADADRQLAGHPDLADAWADARRLAARLDGVAWRATGRRMGQSLDGTEPYTAASAEDAAEVARIESRLDQFEAEAEGPIVRFERMTGRRLSERPDLSEQPEPTRRRGHEPAPVRPLVAEAPVRRRSVPRWSAAVAVLVVLYGVFVAASATAVTPREQLADLGSIRADAPTPQDPPDSLSTALQAVRDARAVTLSLSPVYDPASLDSAAAQLAVVAESAAPGSWTSQEARIALGRVHLHRQRDLEAARVLGGLVREGGYRAPIARRLLDSIRAGME